MALRIVLFIIFIFLVESLTIRTINKFFTEKNIKKKITFYYWIFVLVLLVFSTAYYLYIQFGSMPDHVQFRKFFTLTAVFLLNLLPKMALILFSGIDDLIVLTKKTIGFFRKSGFSKNHIFQKPLLILGCLFSAFIFFQIVLGMLWGKGNFKVVEVSIVSEKIPDAFKGFKIAHISDMHLGSFKNSKILKKGISLLLAQKPDLIVITGDIVNNEVSELNAYTELLKTISAPYGVYSVLGNHDMGDYRRWYNEREKLCNLKLLVKTKEEFGIKVLMNSHDYIKKESDSIAIIGVENWGTPPFSAYGDLMLAVENLPTHLFSILLSHDPSHWDAEVLKSTSIPLTLSGHTHGFQFGFDFGRVRFSPVQFKYKRWGGLYEESGRFLYVNRGFGYIGFAGRVGMYPEITVITLNNTL